VLQDQRWISYLLATAGIILILVGLARGEAADVMQKAVLICLECIGIR
jgi:hypothetical protein